MLPLALPSSLPERSATAPMHVLSTYLEETTNPRRQLRVHPRLKQNIKARADILLRIPPVGQNGYPVWLQGSSSHERLGAVPDTFVTTNLANKAPSFSGQSGNLLNRHSACSKRGKRPRNIKRTNKDTILAPILHVQSLRVFCPVHLPLFFFQFSNTLQNGCQPLGHRGA